MTGAGPPDAGPHGAGPKAAGAADARAARQDRDRTPTDDADVCVVGSGPGGAIVAANLARRGHDVVILEAGRRFDREERLSQMERALRPGVDQLDVWEMGGERDAYETTDADVPLNAERVKGVGGTSLHWGAVTPRLHESDFQMQSRHGLAADWPIDYADLRPYYAAAERELGVSGTDDSPFGPPREEPFPMPGFPPSYADSIYAEGCAERDIAMHTVPHAIATEQYEGRSGCQGYGTCQPVCPSGAKYSADVHVDEAIELGATVVDRAQVSRLEHDADGETVTAARYSVPDGSEYRQEADAFVLACGGVETPRLLLLSSSDHYPDGLANSSGQVGRNLMGHPHVGCFGRLPDRRTGQNEIGFVTSVSHEFYDHEDAPGSFQLSFGNDVDATGLDLAHRQETWGDELADSVEQFGNRALGIFAVIEQLPDPENRVRLSDSETDNLGNPVPEIDWSVGEHALETASFATDVMEDVITAAGGDVTYVEDAARKPLGAHHMGTTRMGTDPEESVVSPELRTHDLANLYVSSSSTFTTGGAVNPTLTIAALGLKAADHVHEQLSG